MSDAVISASQALGEPSWRGVAVFAHQIERRSVFPYWLLFAMWLFGALRFASSHHTVNSSRAFVVAASLTALMIGLRYHVGGDWETYLATYQRIFFQPLIPALSESDPAYALANWIAVQLGVGIWLPNTICAIVFTVGVGRLALRQPQPWLAMLIAIPYLVIVVAMGYTRQAAAIGLVCLAIADATETNLKRTVIVIGAAALFHKTAILMLPVALGPIALRRFVTAVLGVIAFAGMFAIILLRQSERLITSYAQGHYDSSGAGIRIAMNVVAGSIYLLMRKRMGLSPYQQTYWTLNALLSFLSLAGLLSLSSSSGVDRLALFLIPLQFVTLSRLPQAVSNTGKAVPSVFIAVLFYCAAVQFVWLNYATNADWWLPYSSFILPAEH